MPREAELRRIEVAAGILRDACGRFLITERLEAGPFYGLWEFPGGKIGAGEAAEAALVRELREEIGIEVLDLSPFLELEHRYPDRHVDIRFFLVEAWRHEPAGLEGQRLRWVAARDLHAAQLLPADQPVIEALRERLPAANRQ
jgi:8-oxo-dGTP diphosphatase